MGTTTFTGPIKAGDILQTSGTTLGRDVANVGFVVMAQSSPVTQADGTTSIVIPANSQILTVSIMATAAWSGAAATFGVGFEGDATGLTAAAALTASAVGPLAASPGTDATRAGKWINVGATDRQILVTSTNTGTGEGVISVTYVQAIELV
jgi:hypothetical protein